MSNFSTFSHFYMRKRYYLLHPIVFIRHFHSFLKATWKRITKGYCNCDCYNFCDWYCDVVPKMLRDLADNAVGCPAGFEDIEGMSDWRMILHEIALHFENAKDVIDRNPYNPFTDEWRKWFDDQDKFQQDELALGMEMLRKYFFTMWD